MCIGFGGLGCTVQGFRRVRGLQGLESGFATEIGDVRIFTASRQDPQS